MDSEHRHELEENALAKWLERELNTLKPKLPGILIVLIALIGGYFGWTTYNQSLAAEKAESWREYSLALEGIRPSLNVLKQTAEEHPDSLVEEWSLITWADGRLWNASSLYMRDRAKSDEALAESEEAYQSLIGSSSSDIIGRANYGLARILEMKGELEAASEQYGKVTGMFAEIAKERAEYLKGSQAKKSYAWITKVEAAPTEEATTALETEAVEEELDASSTLDDILSATIGDTEEEPAAADEQEAIEDVAEEATDKPSEE